MSRPFHSRITRQNRSKNERAMPKGLDAKGHKNQKSETNIPRVFAISFKKKRIIQIRLPKVWMGWGRGALQLCVRTCISN